MRKRAFVFLLSLMMLLSVLPISAFASSASITSISLNDGVLSVGVNGGGDLVRLRIYDGDTVIHTDEMQASGSSVQFGIPVRSIPLGTYSLSVIYTNRDGTQGDSRIIKKTMGTENPPVYTSTQQYATSTDNLLANAQTPGFSRAVMVPYATVYSDIGMSAKKHELKRFDIVNVLSCNDKIAHVQYTILSGEGKISVVDSTNAKYEGSSKDINGTGYMYMSAFKSSAVSVEDKQREVIELAYSRLGARGIYSQSKRYIGYYLDCSALASWCWYQVGYDFGTGTACDGIYNWAKSVRDRNVIVWDAGLDHTIIEEELEGYRIEHPHLLCPCGCTFQFVNGGKTYLEEAIASYQKTFEFKIFKEMQPGDIVLYNYYRTLTETCHEGTFNFPVNENGAGGYGLDHAAIFVGYKDGKVTLIESSAPSTNASDNTKITTVTESDSKIKSIVAVIRPTGGNTIDGGIAYTFIGYGGASHIEFNGTGELSAPIANPAYNNGSFVGSEYGMRYHPVYHVMKMHTGVDVRAGWDTPIYAANDGVVRIWSNTCPPNHENCKHGGGYGNYMDIVRDDGLVTRYAHMSRIKVSDGQTVKTGDKIGYVGSSGTSTGPHLHFEVRVNGATQNPRNYVSFVN